MVAVDVRQYQMVIDGELVDSSSGETMQLVNPATNQPIATVPRSTEKDVDRAVAAARSAFEGAWGRVSALKRARLMMKLGEVIRDRVDELAQLETLNSGKAISSSKIEILAAVEDFEFYAGATTKITGETIPAPFGMLYYTMREPIGVAGQIIPWNYPFLMAAWKVAPAIAAGNTVVLKPASLTPLTAFKLGELALEAGIPPGVVNVISGPGAQIGSYLAGHPGVGKVAFTGETATGRTIMQLASQTMKRVTLELGGKSPNIVFADANIDDAVNGSIFAIFYNGGNRPDDSSLQAGNFLLPTILGKVENHMRVAQEEIFGPVVVVIPFSDEAEVIALANDTMYGLAGTLWTRDVARAHRVAGAVETGVLGINTFATAMPGLPFGGYKQSGIGRERGFETLKQYTEVKSVIVNTSDRPVNPWKL